MLGFPNGQFHQELDDNAEIAAACELNHGVTFPLFAKIDVNGESAHPLFRLLSNEARGLFGSRMIKWNFTKFLADRNGRVVRRFSPNDKPEHLEELIKKLLANKPSP